MWFCSCFNSILWKPGLCSVINVKKYLRNSSIWPVSLRKAHNEHWSLVDFFLITVLNMPWSGHVFAIFEKIVTATTSGKMATYYQHAVWQNIKQIRLIKEIMASQVGVLGIPVMSYGRAVRPRALNCCPAALKCPFGHPSNVLSSIPVWPSMSTLCLFYPELNNTNWVTY